MFVRAIQLHYVDLLSKLLIVHVKVPDRVSVITSTVDLLQYLITYLLFFERFAGRKPEKTQLRVKLAFVHELQCCSCCRWLLSRQTPARWRDELRRVSTGLV